MNFQFLIYTMDTFALYNKIYANKIYLYLRYKQVVAKRLAIAGLNVAYGRKNYPTRGPFPVDLKAGLYKVPYSPPMVSKHIGSFSKRGGKKGRKRGEKKEKNRQKKSKGQKIEV